jgi:hypothetical protein
MLPRLGKGSYHIIRKAVVWPDIAGEKPWQALFEFISIYFNLF